MRIGYVVADKGIPVFGSKGASVHVREMIRALGREHDVDLFCAALGAGSHELPVHRLCHVPSPHLDSSGDAVLDRDLRRLAGVEAMTGWIGAAHEDAPYDVIYERYSLFSNAGCRVARSSRVPLLLEVNAPLIVERQRVEALPLVALARQREKEVFRAADAVLCVSEPVVQYVRERGADDHCVHVVPNGVDVSRFHPGISGDGIRSRYGIGSALTVGFTGSLKPWHGVDLLLDAFHRVALPDWRLLIVGEGPEGESLRVLAHELGIRDQVIFTGAVHHDEIPGYVAAFDIAAAPYRGSADFYFSPLKLYEYLATGRAVIASRVGQIAHTVRHLENGYLVPSDDVAALAAGLRTLATDPALRQTLGTRAPHGVVSWEQTAQTVLAIAAEARRAA